MISSTIRDLQITILSCNGILPKIEVPSDFITVKAGEIVDFEVIANLASDGVGNATALNLEAFGGPLVIASEPALFEQNDRNYEGNATRKRFQWTTSIENIKS